MPGPSSSRSTPNSRRAVAWLVIALQAAGAVLAVARAGTIPESERDVLNAIYKATNGHGWKNSELWRDNPQKDDPKDMVDECIWHGVICDNDLLVGPTPHVVQLNLSNNYLAGSLPSLDGLPFLVTLDVSKNNGVAESAGPLTGAIPSLVNLPNLKVFRGNFNKFTGTVPSLSGMSQLVEFNIDDNQLSGALPSLAGLLNLETFSATNQNYTPANGNQFSGSIPGLSGLTKLKTFTVGRNKLSGAVPSLTGLTALQGIDVSNNQLTGTLPSFDGLPALGSFFASSNQLSGTIPSLAGVPNLTDFSVANNALTGSIPSITNMSFLRTFHVERNQLTGSVGAFTGLPQLTGYYADHNQLTGSLPSLTGAGNLAELNVSFNQLSGTLPTLRQTSTNQMIAIHLDHNQFTGALPAPPQFLTNGMSSICPNGFTQTASSAWSAATGFTPWWATPTASNHCDDAGTALITVAKAGSGTGTVTAGSGAINCGATCSDSYATGSNLTLTAAPANGHQFTGWLGPCTGTGNCVFSPSTAATVTATFASAPVGTHIANVDGNSGYDALTDGLLALRYLFGLSGPSLTNNALGSGATRSDPATIGTYLADVKPMFDIDGNGQADALTDGLLVMRYLFGLRGATLIAGAIGTGATRTTSTQIEAYLQSIMP